MASIRQVRSSALLGFMLVGVLLFQFAAFDASHGQNHARHCCAACHAGHISATAEVTTVKVIPAANVRWHVPIESSQLTAEQLVVSGCSRAPPA